MTNFVDRKVVILGIVAIFGITILLTIVLTSFSTSEKIKSDLFDINGANNVSGSLSDKTLSNMTESNDTVKSFTLVQTEFGFNGSDSGPTIQVNKGDVVKIAIINSGTMSHNFGMGEPSKLTMSTMKNISGLNDSQKIRKIPYDVLAKMPCPDCHPKFEKGHIKSFIKPGEMVVTTFTASEAGSFKYFCMVRGHLWLGMNGNFIVNDVNSSSLKTKEIMA